MATFDRWRSHSEVASHPCLAAKISQLRSVDTTAKETKELIHEIAFMVAFQALGEILTVLDGDEVAHSPHQMLSLAAHADL